MTSSSGELSRDVKRLCREAGHPTSDGEIDVALEGDRTQRVRVVEVDDDSLQIETVVARSRRLGEVEHVALRAWRRNRGTRLVGFRVDHRGHLLGHAWVPRAGLTADDLAIYVHAVALEADRFEFLLTGLDVE